MDRREVAWDRDSSFPSGCISWISCCVFSRLQKRVGEEERERMEDKRRLKRQDRIIYQKTEEASNISSKRRTRFRKRETRFVEGFLWSFDSFDCSFDSWSWRWRLSSCVSRLAFFLFSFLLSVFFPLLLLPSSIFFWHGFSLQSGDQSYLSSLPMSSLRAGLFYPASWRRSCRNILPSFQK